MRIHAANDRHAAWRERLWREWCFLRAVLAHRGWSLAILAGILAGGAAAFRALEPGRESTWVESIFRAWSLVFGEASGAFPRDGLLQLLYFLVPILGLTIVVEAIVEVSLMVRDRRRGEAEWCRIMANSMENHVVLVGLGKLGIRVFHLLRAMGTRVVVIEREPLGEFLEDVRRDGSPLFLGDAARGLPARRRDLARAEHRPRDRRRPREPRDRARRAPVEAGDPRRAAHVRSEHGREGGRGISDPRRALHRRLVGAGVRGRGLEKNIVASTLIDGVLVVTQRCVVPAGSPAAGRTVGDLARAHGVGIVELRPKSGSPRLFPTPETLIEAGDEILVQGPFDVLERVDFDAAVVA